MEIGTKQHLAGLASWRPIVIGWSDMPPSLCLREGTMVLIILKSSFGEILNECVRGVATGAPTSADSRLVPRVPSRLTLTISKHIIA